MDDDAPPYLDADNHLYEPDDAFTRHIEARYAPHTVRVERDAEGWGRVFFGDRPAELQPDRAIGPTGAPPPPGFFAGLRTGDLADPHRFTLEAFRAAKASYGADVPGVDRDAHIARLDMAAGAARNGPWLGGPLPGRPSEIFREHVLVSPYMVEDLVGLVELVGPQSVVYGSDFPHPEDAQPPREYRDRLAPRPEADIRAIMYDNLAAALDLG